MPHDAVKAVSRRTAELGEAAIQHMAQRARALQAAGRSIINLSIGEPDFATPAHICAAAGRAIADGFTHYAPIAGFPELREAIVGKLKDGERARLPWRPRSSSPTGPSRRSPMRLRDARSAGRGDPYRPFWSSYEQIASLAGGRPSGAEDAQRGRIFKLRPEDLARR
jgi:aspartate aminotransferase